MWRAGKPHVRRRSCVGASGVALALTLPVCTISLLQRRGEGRRVRGARQPEEQLVTSRNGMGCGE